MIILLTQVSMVQLIHFSPLTIATLSLDPPLWQDLPSSYL